MELLRRGRARVEFESFVAKCSAELLRTAHLLTGDLAETEELVQECFLRLARRWPKVRGMDHPDAYARRVLVNLAVDGSKRRARRKAELDSALGAIAALELLTSEDPSPIEGSDRLLAALGTLPTRQRAVLVLRYYGDLSEAEAADMLGCSLGTIKSTSSRALLRLQEILSAPVATYDCQAQHSQSTGQGASDGTSTRV